MMVFIFIIKNTMRSTFLWNTFWIALTHWEMDEVWPAVKFMMLTEMKDIKLNKETGELFQAIKYKHSIRSEIFKFA